MTDNVVGTNIYRYFKIVFHILYVRSTTDAAFISSQGKVVYFNKILSTLTFSRTVLTTSVMEMLV